MNKETVILKTVVFLLLLALIYREIIHRRARRRAYKEGNKRAIADLADSLYDLHYWFSVTPAVFNTLFLLAHRLRKLEHFADPASLRSAVEKLGDKRYADLPAEEVQRIAGISLASPQVNNDIQNTSK